MCTLWVYRVEKEHAEHTEHIKHENGGHLPEVPEYEYLNRRGASLSFASPARPYLVLGRVGRDSANLILMLVDVQSSPSRGAPTACSSTLTCVLTSSPRIPLSVLLPVAHAHLFPHQTQKDMSEH